MVASSAEIVLAPILVPVVVQFGIDPVHFGVIMVFVLIIGGATPPVGVLLFVALANSSHGIRIVQDASNNVVRDNQISGNQGRAVSTDGAGSHLPRIP